MTDYETLDQLLDTTSLVLAGMSLLATVVFAYIAAAFFFLHRAPLVTKVVTYLFFLFSVIFLTGNLFGLYLHTLATIEQIDALALRDGASILIRATSEGQTDTTTAIGFWSFVAVIIGVMAMTFWMTFFWKPGAAKN